MVRLSIVGSLAIVLMSSANATDQRPFATTTGEIEVRIHDASGQPIPGVAVTADSTFDNRKGVTNDRGEFGFYGLTPASYTVSASGQIAGHAPVTTTKSVVSVQREDTVQIRWVADSKGTLSDDFPLEPSNEEFGMGEISGQIQVGFSPDETLNLVLTGGTPAVRVDLYGSSSMPIAITATDNDGRFHFQAEGGKSYEIRAWLQNFTRVVLPAVHVRPKFRTVADAVIHPVSPNCEGLVFEPWGPGEMVCAQTPLGGIFMKLDSEHAPITVANFLKYVDARAYDGGRFYRVTRPDNYIAAPPDRPMMNILQGGLGPAKTATRFTPIPLERTSVTGLKHVRGALSMARGAPDSATSEFFILLEDQPSLDFGGKRFTDGQGGAVFGRVGMGFDVVQKIHTLPASGQNLSPAIPISTICRVVAGDNNCRYGR